MGAFIEATSQAVIDVVNPRLDMVRLEPGAGVECQPVFGIIVVSFQASLGRWLTRGQLAQAVAVGIVGEGHISGGQHAVGGIEGVACRLGQWLGARPNITVGGHAQAVAYRVVAVAGGHFKGRRPFIFFYGLYEFIAGVVLVVFNDGPHLAAGVLLNGLQAVAHGIQSVVVEVTTPAL